ncbi:DUF5320 domain-containing protein [bacterium]|nr:DUF5320 domain-containing protein [bacterium]MCK4596802.1 DUF5320 domain-containing protein [bacterium]
MPGFDGTGPRGMGSRTGGGFGFCPPGVGPASGQGWFPRGVGRGGLPWGGGRGRAWGGGRGWGWPAISGEYPPPYGVAPSPAQWTPEQEMDSLKAQAEAVEQELQAIRQRIGDLEAQGKKG